MVCTITCLDGLHSYLPAINLQVVSINDDCAWVYTRLGCIISRIPHCCLSKEERKNRKVKFWVDENQRSN